MAQGKSFKRFRQDKVMPQLVTQQVNNQITHTFTNNDSGINSIG